MGTTYRTTRRVEFRDTDCAGIVHFSNFFWYMEQAEHEFLRHLGLSVLMADEEGEVTWPRVRASCEYSGAIRFEEIMDVSLQITRIGDKSVTYSIRFEHNDRPVASGELVAVCCRFIDGIPKSMSMPESFRSKLQPFVV